MTGRRETDEPTLIGTTVLMMIVGATIALAPSYEAAIYFAAATSVTVFIVRQARSWAMPLVLGVIFGLGTVVMTLFALGGGPVPLDLAPF